MDTFIPISELNDFIFCPYSIYLHNVFMGVDRDVYQAKPQVQGTAAHREETEAKVLDHNILAEISVVSEKIGIQGVIDIYDIRTETLIENKYQLKNIYLGQLLQIWGQYYCMKEMGYKVSKLQFHVISSDTNIDVPIPDDKDYQTLVDVVYQFRRYRPEDQIQVNPNKCSHCIYNPLCDKTGRGNVYE